MADVPAPNYAAFQPDPFGEAAKASNYVNQLYDRANQTQDRAAMQTAGGQYAGGDYSGAAGTLARTGNIQGAQQVQQAGQQANSAGIQALAKAFPTFKGIYDKTAAGGPQAQSQAVRHALAVYAPELKATTGISDQTIAAIDQGFATDPGGTLERLYNMLPDEFKTSGQTVMQFHGGDLAHTYSTSPNEGLYVGGPSADGQPAPQGAPPAAVAPPSAGGGGLVSADPTAVSQVESRGNPAAVSTAGAVGTMQTMPGTLQSPGYGVAPAANNTSAEQTRVGQDYVAAMTQKYGPAIGLVAYNMGPGATDKWLASGGDFAKLPDETQKYIGRVAIQEAMSRRQAAGRAVPQAAPAPQAPPQGGGFQVQTLRAAQPEFRAATPEERARGVNQVNTKTNEEKMMTTAAMAAGTPVDAAVDYFISSGGQFPPGQRSPQTSLRILQGAQAKAAQSGQKLSDIIGYGAERKADAATLTQLTELRGKVGTYISTFDKNVDSLRAAIPKGAANSTPILNRWIQYGRKEVQGDPDVARLNTWMTAVRDEYARILSGSSGSAGITDSARNEADGIISKIDSIPAMYATLDTMHAESRNRVGSLDTAISDLNAKLRNSFQPRPQGQQNAPAPKSQASQGGGKVIRYDANGNRLP